MKHIEEQPRGLSENAMLLKVNEIITKMNAHHERLAALEAASKSASNYDLKRALIDAQNAIDKALNHFRTTAEENRYGK